MQIPEGIHHREILMNIPPSKGKQEDRSSKFRKIEQKNPN